MSYATLDCKSYLNISELGIIFTSRYVDNVTDKEQGQ